uniref:Uncharacterized protein n=1 Tax=Rhizophora mucronata TaxID=61149 RepID=A0A2P2NEQ7_RHIMU
MGDTRTHRKTRIGETRKR